FADILNRVKVALERKVKIMSRWAINLIEVGRGKVTRTVTANYKTLPPVEERAVRECKKHLESRDVALSHKSDMYYRVLADFRPVGTVFIQSL
ncbi:unnamed protein product, partial [marine sediment metagenome]